MGLGLGRFLDIDGVMEMGKILAVILLPLLLCGFSGSSGNEAGIVERAIGRLVVLHDKSFSYENGDNPFGAAIVFEEFKSIYEGKISRLSTANRVDFLWAAMWHLDLDGHLMMQFQEIVVKDCAEDFIDRLEGYVEKESELGRHKDRLHYSVKVLIGLRQAMVAQQQWP